MYLKEVELFGFKSFANKTRLSFSNGKIFAIVGPNGAGKSNITDAIRWVLGEQSAKSLRGQKMDDVIFKGTSSRKAMGYAEVKIIFNNSDKFLPIEYEEVEIKRRVYTSGESDYFINNNSCYLRDIQELFMDTGIGTNSYSFIEQKMIEQILNENDNERRFLFEQAAGITKYKVRRKNTFKKIDDTNNNLIRINDLIYEIENKVKELKKQVKQTLKYKKIQDKIKNLEVFYYKKEIENLKTKKIKLDEEFQSKTIEREKYSGEVNNQKERINSIDNDMTFIDTDIRKIQNEIDNINRMIKQNEQTILLSEERKYFYNQENERLRNDISYNENRIENSEKEKKYSETELEEKSELKKEVSERLIHIDKKLSEINVQHSEKKEEVDTVKNREKEINREYQKLRDKINSLSHKTEYMRNELNKYDENIEKHSINKENFSQELKSTEEEIAKQNELISSFENKIEKLKSQNIEKEAEYKKIEEELNNELLRLKSFQTEYNLLSKMEQNLEGYENGIKRVYKEFPNISKKITADLIISIESEYEKAVLSYLEYWLQSLIIEKDEDMKEVLNYLSENKTERVKFIMKINREKDSETDNLGVPLRDCVKLTEKGIEKLSFIFKDSFIISSLENIESYEVKGNPVFITKNGEIADYKNGVFISSGKVPANSDLIGRKERVKLVGSKIEEVQKSIDKVKDNRNEIQNTLEHLNAEIGGMKNILRKHVNENFALDKKRNEIHYRYTNSVEALENLHKNKEKTVSELKEAEENLSGLTGLKDDLKEKLDEIIFKLGDIEEELSEITEEKEYLNSEKNKQSILNIELKNACEKAEKNISDCVRIMKESADKIEKNRVQIDKYRKEINIQEENYKKAKEKNEIDLSKRTESIKKLDSKIQKKQELVEDKNKLMKKLNESQNSLYKTSERISELKANIENLDRQIIYMKDFTAELFNTSIDNIEVDEEKISRYSDLSFNEIHQNILKLKGDLDKFGAVNLLAVEEYDKESERLDFILKQKEDLLTAKDNLNQAIKKINKKARALFLETFNEINENFKTSFTDIFPYGSAYLELEEDQDPLNAKIYIYANTKGKKAKKVNLLSSGEKALTAISILFSIYLIKPSPFCLLDEIDAPLDDANTEKFLHLIKNFTNRTQFAFITHNKKTMEAADSLYGVTMEEVGISKIVSVNLNRFESSKGNLEMITE